MTRKTLLVFLSFLLATGINARSVGLFGHDKLDVSDTVRFAVNPFTGAIDELTVEGDKHHMNWIVKTDGSQYPWITERYSWGLGYFTQVKGHESLKKEWMRPLVVEDEGKKVLYKEGDVLIRAERSMDGGDLIEEYTFTNKGGERIWLYDIAISPISYTYLSDETSTPPLSNILSRKSAFPPCENNRHFRRYDSPGFRRMSGRFMANIPRMCELLVFLPRPHIS